MAGTTFYQRDELLPIIPSTSQNLRACKAPEGSLEILTNAEAEQVPQVTRTLEMIQFLLCRQSYETEH